MVFYLKLDVARYLLGMTNGRPQVQSVNKFLVLTSKMWIIVFMMCLKAKVVTCGNLPLFFRLISSMRTML